MVVKVASKKFHTGNPIENSKDMKAQRKIVWKAPKTWHKSRLRDYKEIPVRERRKLRTIIKDPNELKRRKEWGKVEKCEILSDFWKAIGRYWEQKGREGDRVKEKALGNNFSKRLGVEDNSSRCNALPETAAGIEETDQVNEGFDRATDTAEIKTVLPKGNLGKQRARTESRKNF
ncbi:hypothetical protein QAD02_021870 [Eretmocerus hayati]|uniref:Uncharacterized protein n=1 Tax=Eretmocerus hayati TaxID=131215 RepID=A0ACC2PRE1_9HYME|nr:hypothetical protein QAD02_021870 [Eretmocerus hayati]